MVKREYHKDSLNEFTDGECKKDEKGGKHVNTLARELKHND